MLWTHVIEEIVLVSELVENNESCLKLVNYEIFHELVTSVDQKSSSVNDINKQSILNVT